MTSFTGRFVLPLVRRWIRFLSTESERPSVFGRAWRTVLLVPPFSVLVLLLRLRLLFRGPLETECRARFGSRFRCRLPDLIQLYIDLFGVWEPDVSAFIERRLGRGGCFVDVGANIGYDALLAASRVGSEGRVIAIEASPVTAKRLRAHVDLNEAGDIVRVVEAAVTDRSGTVTVFEGPAHNIGLSSTRQHRGMKRGSEVPSARLSGLLEPDEVARARLLKIDVEGGEDAVLTGLGDFIDQAPREIEVVVELSPKWWGDPSQAASDVLKPLMERGFNLYVLKNNYWPWRYLWLRTVQRPTRIRQEISRKTKRIDLVLSRVDAEVL